MWRGRPKVSRVNRSAYYVGQMSQGVDSLAMVVFGEEPVGCPTKSPSCEVVKEVSAPAGARPAGGGVGNSSRLRSRGGVKMEKSPTQGVALTLGGKVLAEESADSSVVGEHVDSFGGEDPVEVEEGPERDDGPESDIEVDSGAAVQRGGALQSGVHDGSHDGCVVGPQ